MLKEAERILRRKLNLGVQQSKQGQHDAERTKKVLNTLLERLSVLAQKTDDQSTINLACIEQFSHELIIAQAFADAKSL